MPSAPVFGNGFRKKRTFKVFRQLQPEGLGDTQGNIHSAGKIGIKLKSEGHRADPDIESWILRIISINGIHNQSHAF